MSFKNVTIGFENFKAFQSLTTCEIAPITLLVGPNNSGKSSFIKTLDLLKQNFSEKGNKVTSLSEIKFALTSWFSSFDEAVNKYSNNNLIKFKIDNLSFDSSFPLFVQETFKDELELLKSDGLKFDKIGFEISYQKNGHSAIVQSLHLYLGNRTTSLFSVEKEGESFRARFDIDHLFPSAEDIRQSSTFNNSLSQKSKVADLDDLTEKEVMEVAKYTLQNLRKLKYLDISILFNDIILSLDSEFPLRNIANYLSDTYYSARGFSPDEEGLDEMKKMEEYDSLYVPKEKKIAVETTNFFLDKYFDRIIEYTVLPLKRHFESFNSIEKIEPTSNWILEQAANNLLLSNKKRRFINKWLQKFNLGEQLEIKQPEDDLQLIYIVQNEVLFRLKDIGEGSQKVVNILLGMITHGKSDLDSSERPLFNGLSSFLIHEPEESLHPHLQSLLGDLLVDMYQEYNVKFIVETHSEYLIRKLQVLASENTIDGNDMVVNYFRNNEETEEGSEKVYPIHFKSDGRLDQEFGPGFYDENAQMMKRHFLNIKSN